MSKVVNKRWRRVLVCALIAAGSAGAAALLGGVRFFQILNSKAYDAHFVVRGKHPTNDIVLVTADQKTLDTFPDVQLFWHTHYANAIRAAGVGGAKVFGLDVAFGIPVEKWEPGHDQQLAEAAVSAPMPVVVAYVSGFNTNPESQRVPLNLMAGGLGLGGYPNLTTDEIDDFIRRQELFDAAPYGDEPAKSLALRVAEKFVGKDAEITPNGMTFLGRRVPLDPNRAMYINYAGGPETFPRVSLADAEAALREGRAEQLHNWFEGKIVLLGTDYTGDSDRRNTPFFTLLSGANWTTAGVEIHANTIQTLLSGNFLQPAPQWLRIATLVSAAGLMAAVAVSFPATIAIPGLFLVGLIAAVFTHILFRTGWILSTSEVLIAATLSLVATIVYRFVTAEQRGDFFRQAVSLFVSERVASSLEDSRAIGLTGKRETVTVLFTDIRGFTAYTERVCEEQGPEFLVQRLNEYLATMAGIVVSFGGHVNKYIGDGILAVFSDEDKGAKPGDHPLRAVRCATRMVTVASEFQTGAGLHTGLAVVGNVGSADKMEYTVLGDTVNLASRLESLNKEHKTKLLMSETTEQALGGSIATAELGSVAVRGKAAPIRLYTVQALIAEEVPHA